MEIVHRIGLNADEQDRAELARSGIAVGTGITAFEVTERDPAWPGLEAWIRRRRPSDVVSTRFSGAEVEAAAWLEVVPDWQAAYPEPRDRFGYRSVTYDAGDACASCGVGLRQVAPFRIAGPVRWGRRSVAQLHWVFDELFVTPALWDRVLRPLGIGSRAVLDADGAELDSIVQLVIDQRVPVSEAGLEATPCPVCGRVRFARVTRGYPPRPTREPAGSIARSEQWFGDGALAANLVLVSQAVRRELDAAKATGIHFAPVEPAEARLPPA